MSCEFSELGEYLEVLFASTVGGPTFLQSNATLNYLYRPDEVMNLFPVPHLGNGV